MEVRTVRAQPSWILRSSTVEVAVTQLCAQMAPVVFDDGSGHAIQPYAISPWQGETEGLPACGSERLLRGDFFCLPFGKGDAPNGEQHPPHGLTSSGPWTLVESSSDAGISRLTLGMDTPVRKGHVTRSFSLVEGESAIYNETVIDGFAGPATMGHHAVLALPAREAALLVSSSPMVFGMTSLLPCADPAEGNYQSLAVGKRFRSLSRVESIFRDVGRVDCSAYPVRAGFTDLLQFSQRPQRGLPAWTAAVNTEGGYVWFALKDPAVLPSTLLWIENRGRHRPPWSGRNCSLGIEDVCSLFDMGITASAAPNPFSRRGVPTFHQLSGEPFRVRYIQGAVRVPSEFGRVRKMLFPPGEVVIVDANGLEVRTAVQHRFLHGADLELLRLSS